jgi:hypothetical protein
MIVLSWAAGYLSAAAQHNHPIWSQFLGSKRPTVFVVGDYYLYGEADGSLGVSRLVRDFMINSDADLEYFQSAIPEEYGKAKAIGLDYIPVSTAFALHGIIPHLVSRGTRKRIIRASDVDEFVLNNCDIIYIGLLSGMKSLELAAFQHSNFGIGMDYDELISLDGEVSFRSEAVASFDAELLHKDYGYFSLTRGEAGGLIAVVAGTRDTGLTGVAELVSSEQLPSSFELESGSFQMQEVIVEVTGRGKHHLDQTVVAQSRKP